MTSMLILLVLVILITGGWSANFLPNSNWSAVQIPRYAVDVELDTLDFATNPHMFVFQAVKSSLSTKVLIFDDPVPDSILFNPPRKVIQTGGTTGEVELPPLPISKSLQTVFHLIKGKVGNYWQVSYSTTDIYYTFLKGTETLSGGIDIEDGKFYIALPTLDTYKTVTAETFFTINETASCTFSIKTKGIVRAIYFDGHYVTSDASAWKSLPEKIIIKRFYKLTPGEYHFITIFGAYIDPTLIFDNCYDEDGEFSYAIPVRYALETHLETSIDVTYNYRHKCTGDCEVCYPECERCNDETFLSYQNCLEFCLQLGTTVNLPYHFNERNYCGGIKRRATALSMSYDNTGHTYTFDFLTEYANEQLFISIYQGVFEIANMFTRMENTTTAMLGKGIVTTDANGQAAGSISVTLPLPEAEVDGFTILIDRIKTDFFYFGEYDSAFYSTKWISELQVDELYSKTLAAYARVGLIAKCVTPGTCTFNIMHDGSLDVYKDGSTIINSVNHGTTSSATTVSVTDLAFLSIKIEDYKKFQIVSNSQVILSRVEETIYSYTPCLDYEDNSIIKNCFCHWSCTACSGPEVSDCASTGCRASTETVWDPLGLACICVNSVDPLIQMMLDEVSQTCDCTLGRYNDSPDECDGTCDISCWRCTGPNANECTRCAPNRDLVGNTCVCNLPWQEDPDHETCSVCTGYMLKGIECLSTCPGNSTTNYDTAECIQCEVDADCISLPATPFCSVETPNCIHFKADIEVPFVSTVTPVSGIIMYASLIDQDGITITSLSAYTFTWTMDYEIANEKLGNTFKILPFISNLHYPDTITIYLKVTHSSGFISKSEVTLALNQRPYANSLVSPSEGRAFTEIFNLTLQIIDTEQDGPFTVEWRYLSEFGGVAFLLQERSENFTYLGTLPHGKFNLGVPGMALLFIQATYWDVYGLKSYLHFGVVTRIPIMSTGDISGNLSNIDPTLDNLDDTTDLAEIIDSIDEETKNNYNDPCATNCSFHGSCVNNACKCNTGYTAPDCSLSTDDYQEQLDLKEQFLEYAQKICTANNLRANSTILKCLTILESITTNIQLSPPEIGQPVMDLLKKTLVNVKDLVLDAPTIFQAAEVVSNLINYHKEDCEKYETFGFTVVDNIEYFFDTIQVFSSKLLEIDGDPQYIEVENFKMYTARVSKTNLPHKELKFSRAEYPTLKFPSSGIDLDKSVVNIQYILWHPNMFDCDSTNPWGFTLEFKVDRTSVSIPFTLNNYVDITYTDPDPNFACISDCIPESGTLTKLVCACEDGPELSVARYISNNLKSATEKPGPDAYSLKKLVALNICIPSIGLLFMILGIVLDRRYRRDLATKSKGMCGNLLAYIQISHVFLSTIFKHDTYNSRALRTFLYIVRLFGMEAFSLLFNQDGTSLRTSRYILLSIAATLAVSIPNKLAYNLIMFNDVMISNQGNIRFKKAGGKLSNGAKPFGFILITLVLGLYLAAIILFMKDHDPAIPMADRTVDLFWRCLLFDFIGFQILKLLPQLILIASVHHRPGQPKAKRDTVLFLTERYVLRYYLIFYLQEIKAEN